MSVPSWPCQKPLIPSCRYTSRITATGRKGATGAPSDTAGAWILHLTSSMGVRTKEVKTPDIAPVNHSDGSDSSLSREAIWARYRSSRPTFSNRKRLLVSAAAPNKGALIPLYSPRKPSDFIDCRKQSKGPVYRNGKWSGWLCSRTLTVSKGYSMYFPAMPATYSPITLDVSPWLSNLLSSWCVH